MDTLLGGGGSDLGCAVADETTVLAGEENTFALAANDEVLDDEGVDDVGAIAYAQFSLGAGISAAIDSATVVITFTATNSGSVVYSATRSGSSGNLITSFASFLISILPVDPGGGDPGGSGEGSDSDRDDAAGADVADSAELMLPVTGGGDGGGNLITIGGLGIALLIGGLALVRRTMSSSVQSGSGRVS